MAVCVAGVALVNWRAGEGGAKARDYKSARLKGYEVVGLSVDGVFNANGARQPPSCGYLPSSSYS